MNILTYLTALLLSGVAEYYSVIGLTAIFPGSFWPVVVMGCTLGVAKLVTITWLYRNWKISPLLMKVYLTIAVVILMTITSMGIFGYLSKAHLEHSTETAPLMGKVELIDQRIKVVKENIDDNRKALKQLDEAVDQIMARSQDEKGADKAVAIRKGQAKERTRLLQDIETQQKKLATLNEERAPLATEVLKVESDFGPIKYVAELVYGSGEKDIVDKAVRLVIIMIMVVFDPLAVLLLIAANISMMLPKPKEEVEESYKPDAWVADVTLPDDVTIPEPVPEPKPETVQVPKENLIVIDEASQESIPPLTIHHAPGVYEEHHVPPVAETKYDYDDSYSFREKDKK
jgi:hypothetical protein